MKSIVIDDLAAYFIEHVKVLDGGQIHVYITSQLLQVFKDEFALTLDAAQAKNNGEAMVFIEPFNEKWLTLHATLFEHYKAQPFHKDGFLLVVSTAFPSVYDCWEYETGRIDFKKLKFKPCQWTPRTNHIQTYN